MFKALTYKNNMQNFPEHLFDIIHDFLDTIDWISADYHLAPLCTDSSNYTFQLVSRNEPYFVKYFGQTQFIPYDRKKVFDLQLALSQQGLAIEPIEISKDCTIQIEKWQPKSLKLPRELCITKSAKILSRLHQTSINAEPLELVTHWGRYLALCPEHTRSQFRERIAELKSDWKAQELTHLCHNDLSFDHIVNAESQQLYDWEYVAMGNPYFDLASTIEVNQLSSKEIDSFVVLYGNNSEIPLDKIHQQVSKMRPLVQLTSDIWWVAYHHQNKMLQK